MKTASRTTRKLVTIPLMASLACGSARGVLAYQTYGVEVGGKVVTLRRHLLPVRYFITDRDAPGVTALEFQAAVDRAFATWQRVRSAGATASDAGFTAADPFEDDGMSTLGFLSRPDLDRVLGATDFLIDTTTGDLVESDIFLNAAFPWSVEPGGQTGRFDVESIALHEIGHLFGLGHSALGESELRPGGGRRVIAAETVMFPIAYSPGNVSGRILRADDIAGISDLYPASGFSTTTGTITGRVTKNGRGVFGAHVVAFSPATGLLVGGLTLNQNGDFRIAGLSPGPHVIRVEPIDDAEPDSFFDDPAQVDVKFMVTYASRFAVAPRGGVSEQIVVAVTSK